MTLRQQHVLLLHLNCNYDASHATAQGHMFLFPDYVCFDSRLINHETTITMPYTALAEVHFILRWIVLVLPLLASLCDRLSSLLHFSS